jgi:hypothetical protein
VMAPVWNLLFLTVDFVVVVELYFTNYTVSKLTESSGPIYGSLMVISVPKLRSTASSFA